jgi:hypothetical protein
MGKQKLTQFDYGECKYYKCIRCKKCLLTEDVSKCVCPCNTCNQFDCENAILNDIELNIDKSILKDNYRRE